MMMHELTKEETEPKGFRKALKNLTPKKLLGKQKVNRSSVAGLTPPLLSTDSGTTENPTPRKKSSTKKAQKSTVSSRRFRSTGSVDAIPAVLDRSASIASIASIISNITVSDDEAQPEPIISKEEGRASNVRKKMTKKHGGEGKRFARPKLVDSKDKKAQYRSMPNVLVNENDSATKTLALRGKKSLRRKSLSTYLGDCDSSQDDDDDFSVAVMEAALEEYDQIMNDYAPHDSFQYVHQDQNTISRLGEFGHEEDADFPAFPPDLPKKQERATSKTDVTEETQDISSSSSRSSVSSSSLAATSSRNCRRSQMRRTMSSLLREYDDAFSCHEDEDDIY